MVASSTPLNVEDKAFLDRFPRPERSTIANLFLGVIRSGTGMAEQVAADVAKELRQRIARQRGAVRSYAGSEWAFQAQERYEQYQRWVATVEGQSGEALRYAAYCIAYERLPRTERERIKSGRATEAIAAWQSQQPASDAQKRYLRDLGYTGDVDALSKADASAEIGRRKRAGG